uniref:PTC1-like winged helix-turn-helix domain-containing protein n=1 Tax=Salix viminalis TaxID=40686 RepID=A0A6N2KT99_SALVM
MDSGWPARRFEYAAQIILNALKEKKENNRQEVRDAARLHIGDTGLLDYVLKSMNNVIVGSHIVCRAVNPSTRVLEYTIHELGNRVLINEPEPEIVPEPLPVPALVPGADVYSDVVYLYTNVLLLYWFVVTDIEDMEGMEDEVFIPALIRLAPCRSMPLRPPGEDPNPTLAIAAGERSDSPRGKRKLGSYAIRISREQRSNLLLPLGPTNNNLFSYTIISVLRYAPTSRGMTLVMPLFNLGRHEIEIRAALSF